MCMNTWPIIARINTAHNNASVGVLGLTWRVGSAHAMVELCVFTELFGTGLSDMEHWVINYCGFYWLYVLYPIDNNGWSLYSGLLYYYGYVCMHNFLLVIRLYTLQLFRHNVKLRLILSKQLQCIQPNKQRNIYIVYFIIN